jgi:hypothetical protein
MPPLLRIEGGVTDPGGMVGSFRFELHAPTMLCVGRLVYGRKHPSSEPGHSLGSDDRESLFGRSCRLLEPVAPTGESAFSGTLPSLATGSDPSEPPPAALGLCSTAREALAHVTSSDSVLSCP